MEETSFIEGEDIFVLPCEKPYEELGALIFGQQTNTPVKSRSASTAVNRIEFADTASTIRRKEIPRIFITMDSGTFNGYRTNCVKRKKKVIGLIELFNKDSITCATHKEIFKDELNKIDVAAEDFIEYIDDVLTQLEANSEQDRIPDLELMRKGVIDAVKLNKQQVIEKVDTLKRAAVPLDSDVASDIGAGAVALTSGTVTADRSTTGASHDVSQTVAKLKLRHTNICEDIDELKSKFDKLDPIEQMSDSEITFYMRRIDSWDQKLKDITNETRKLNEEAIGKDDMNDYVVDLTEKLKNLKIAKSLKADELIEEDKDRGLNSLCENKHKSSVVFPEPFRGVMGENIFKFKKEITAAIKDTQVKKADQVRTLLKYLKGDARARVGDHQPNLDAALQVLESFYGNPNLIWLKYRQEFEKEFSGNVLSKWGSLGSTKRIDAIAKLMEFIRQALQFSEDYPQLKDDILSAGTVKLIMKSMPAEEIRMVYLSVDDVAATHQEKIEKIQDILGKLKNCGILAVNELIDDSSASRNQVSQRQRDDRQGSTQTRNPLGLSSHNSTLCSVDIKHDCTKSRKCEPNWGLLGCEEMYKLSSIDERIQYCKEAGCCTNCGIALPQNSKESTCQRCDYNTPTNRRLIRCNVSWFSAAASRVQRCFRGAALCIQHQSQRNTEPKLIEWLKEKRIKHEMFSLDNKIHKTISKRDKGQHKHDIELPSDQKVLEMLREEMKNSNFETGDIEEIPDGENMFMFFHIQGRSGTEPIQVFADSGANFWFALESVTKKLVCIKTHKNPMPITIGGGNVIYSTGEWAAALPMSNGSFQAVRGQTMKSLVGQMPRYDLTRTLKEVKQQYPENQKLQNLVIPDVLGGEIEMILGSKYLKIYPEPVQITPTGLTVSISRLRSPTGKNTAVISGPVKFINSILQSRHAKDAFDSMKAMLVHARSYTPKLEYFPSTPPRSSIVDEEVSDVEEKYKFKADSICIGLPISCPGCSMNVTVQSELKRFMDLQEAGLKTEFRCIKCRACDDCRKGAGFERISMKQEAEQRLIQNSIEIKEGYAEAKLPFTLPPDENLNCNRNIALKRLDNVIKRYCKDPIMKQGLMQAWDKMINKGHLRFIGEFDPNIQNMIMSSKVSYYIPWNVNFKDSISTPIRTTFDASSQTSTGLSLNDTLAKGNPNLVELLTLALDWMMGPFAFAGDISQFYPSIRLKPEYWKYQRILLRENLDQDGQILEAVLTKLAFGVQSVSAQSEEAVRRIGNELWDFSPDVAFLLISRRYVDDVGRSMMSKQDSLLLIDKTSEVLKQKLDMTIKGWTVSGEQPSADISSDGSSVPFAGFLWYPEMDIYSLNIPPLCLDKKQRGRLPEGSFGFDKSTMTLEDLLSKDLTRRQVTRAIARVWGLVGKAAPVTLRIKHDLRKLIKELPDWDVPMAPSARLLWIQNFDLLESIRPLLYSRCSRPPDALRKTCRLWILVDAAEWGMIATVYAGWERPSGDFSCSHILGKGLLGPEPLTLPQKELHILSVGADIKEIFTSALEEWVEDVLVGSDSLIALCWTSYETVKLNQYNRVRVINITSKLSLSQIYHVRGADNPADIGTRTKSVSASSVFPDS